MIVPLGAVIPKLGTPLLATSLPAASTSCCMVLSPTGSARVSLGSNIVTLLGAVWICKFVACFSSRGVRSSTGGCPRGTLPAGNDRSNDANHSRSVRSLFSCLTRSISSPCFSIFIFFSSEQGFSNSLQFVFRFV